MAESEGEILEVEGIDNTVIDTDDGGAIIKVGPDEEKRPNKEFYANIVEDFAEDVLSTLCTTLLDDMKRDKEARKKREEDYEEAIKRTGLGKETPGGADFEGASKVVHPMLTEACVDFASRAIKELMPPNGPVKVFVPGDNPEPERFAKAERVKNYMNWQFLFQMPDFRSELEQLLTQNSLGGSQYLRLVQDDRKKRPVPVYWPSDDVYIPYAASNFYTAERLTFVEHITEHEFQQRVEGGMYRDLGPAVTSQPEEQTKPEKATNAVEGKEKIEPYNKDGLRNEYDVMCWCELEKDEHGYAPYRITIDGAHQKIAAVNRNWEEDDETKQPMYWAVEFPFIPWRGAGSIGLGQMIGSLSGAATGALRALLDSAHINNLPTLLRLKGVNFSGQSKELNIGEITEVEGGIAGFEGDIRELIMPIPFNEPSEVLLALLGVVTEAGRGVVRTTFEKLGEQSTEMPVGTTLALIEEGMTVFSAIHLRMFQSMTYVLRILNRINRMYLEEEEQKNEIGEVLAYRRDFDPPFDIIPVADPEIFSDVQRMAQLQVVADRSQAMPEIYNQKAVEKRILERTKIPNADELLLPDDTPEEQNAVNENAAMSLGRPVAAFPEQDHLAHLQVHLDYMRSPVLGRNPIIAPSYLPMVLGHLKEHIALYYVTYNFELLQASTGLDDDKLAQLLRIRDPAMRKEMDKNMGVQSQTVVPAIENVLSGMLPIIQETQELLQKMQPEPEQAPTDPNAMAAIAQEQQSDEIRDARERERTQLQLVDKKEARVHQKDIKFMELDAKQRQDLFNAAQEEARKAQEYAARLEELMEKERAEDERTVIETESRELINAEDNLTALEIADVDAATRKETSIKTGEGVTNPRPRTGD